MGGGASEVLGTFLGGGGGVILYVWLGHRLACLVLSGLVLLGFLICISNNTLVVLTRVQGFSHRLVLG